MKKSQPTVIILGILIRLVILICLFGAAKLNLKIVDMPIRYSESVYGETNIQRWKHGWLLLKMVFFAANRLKFI